MTDTALAPPPPERLPEPVDTADTLPARPFTPRQRPHHVSVVLDLPPSPDLARIDRWLAAVLGNATDPTGAAPPARDATLPPHAAPWLARVLALALALLQGARVPAFDRPRVLRCAPDAGDPQRLRVVAALPAIDLLPDAVPAAALTTAGALLLDAVASEPTPQALAAFHARLRRDFLVPAGKAWTAGKSTVPTLRAAFKAGVPFRHLGAGVFQLGWGHRARWMQRSAVDGDSTMGASMSTNKHLSAQLMRAAGLPAPVHRLVADAAQARAAAERLGWPVVVKPLDRDRGEGVTVGVSDDAALQAALEVALKLSPARRALVERQVPGVCHRLFVAGGALLYAVKRLPMSVDGDGRRTVRALVADAVQRDQALAPWLRSGIAPLDDLARATMAAAGFAPDDVPAGGQRVPLRPIESTAWGGVDDDVTAKVHPDNLRVALMAARLFRLDTAGVDIITPDITRPWHENGAVVNEVNFAPLLGGGEISRGHLPEFMHRLLDGGDGRIPVEVFAGGPEAGRAGVRRWQALCAQGRAAVLSDGRRTLASDGTELHLVATDLHDRARALVLRPDVEALVLVVQTDALVHTGLPLEYVDDVQLLDLDALVDHEGASMPHARRRKMEHLLRAWVAPRVADGVHHQDRFAVDVDHPDFQPAVDPIASHSRIAGHYAFRPPYVDEFFVAAARKLGVSDGSTLLDLCCGRGELASRFAANCRQVIAVDGSREMLDRRIAKDNVAYHLLDVNGDDLAGLGPVDHVVIGSAVHWVSHAALKRIISSNLAVGGKVLVTHTLYKFDDEPCFVPLQELNQKYGRSPVNQVDLWGAGKMAQCGYRKLDDLRLTRDVRLGLDDLFRNQLSYAYRDFHARVMADPDRYRADLRATLSPFLADDKLSAKLVNWGVIYAPIPK